MTLTLPMIDDLITDASKRSAERGTNAACHAAINALLTLREETIKLRDQMDERAACQPKLLLPQRSQLTLQFSHAHSHFPPAP